MSETTETPAAEDEGLPWAGSVADEAGRVWSAVFAQNVAAVAEYRGTPAEVDAAFEEDGLVAVAEVVAGVMWAGLARELPQYDDRLAAVLARDGVEVDPAVALASAGYVLQTAAERLAVSLGGRMVAESTGDAICLTEAPETSRYVRAWTVPGVDYPMRAEA